MAGALRRGSAGLTVSVRHVAIVLVSVLVLAQVAEAGARKAKGLYRQGRAAELAGQYDEAHEKYTLATREAPRVHTYTLAERRMRFVAAQARVESGVRLREEGLFEEALAEFERAMAIDPGSAVAGQERRRTLEMIEARGRADEAGRPPEALASALEAEHHERGARVGNITSPPELEPLSSQPINLMLNEESRVAFETIGKLAGINMLFDPDYSDQEIEIEIRNATLTQALDYVSLLAKAFWKPLTHNAVLVTNDNPNKRREYEDEVVKTVYLTNLSTPQDLSEVSTAIRGLTDIRRMFTVNSVNAIVMRGSRAKVAIAEKIVHDMDKPRAEVIVDVLVLETSKTRKRTLGFTPVSGGSNGLQFPLTFGGTASAQDGGAAFPLNRLGHVGSGSWSTTMPGFMLSAIFSNSDTELLQSPRIRTADNQQADLRIGDQVPIASGSFQPGVGGVGISPLVNTQFQFKDVGVNVSLTPKIHANRDVSMHVEIEISNVKDVVDLGGISQPIIGQRTIQHDLRIREGEASVVGGLNQTQLFKTRSGVPFLGEIPVVGRLFSEHDVQRSDSEVLIVLVPHIVRMPGIDASNLRTIATGTEQKFELRYEETGNGKPAIPPLETEVQQVPGPGPTPEPEAEGAPAGLAPEPSADPATQPAPATAEPTEEEPAAQAADSPVSTAEPGERPVAQGPRLFLSPPEVGVMVGQEVTVSIMIGDAVDIASMPLRIQYDRERLRLSAIERGPFMAGQDASDIIFSRSIRHANGLAAVNISRYPGAGGANGEGELITLTFEGLAAGPAGLSVFATGPRDADGTPLETAPLEAEVSVQ